MPWHKTAEAVFTADEQDNARASLARMGVRAKFDSDAAYVVLAYLGQALAHALLVTDSGDHAWLRRAAALHAAWTQLPSVAPTVGSAVRAWVCVCEDDDCGGTCASSRPAPPPPTSCVSCGGAIAVTPTGWRHLDVVDALSGDHDARAEVAL